MEQGKVLVILGNTIVGTPPDAQLVIQGTRPCNDNKWHHASFVRDRAVKKLFLYVDGALDGSAIDDFFPYAIASDRPMTIGRWRKYRTISPASSMNCTVPWRTPPVDDQCPAFVSLLRFREFRKDPCRRFNINRCPVIKPRVPGYASHHRNTCPAAVLLQSGTPPLIAPRSSLSLTLKYLPSAAGHDTLSFLMATNDPERPTAVIRLQGIGIDVTTQPTILIVDDIPGDQGHNVRIVWLRSLYDGLDNSQTIIGYDVWRRVDEGSLVAGTKAVLPGLTGPLSLQGTLWDFIATVPPVGFDEYSLVSPTLYDSTLLHGMRQSVFMVSARTSGGHTYFSDPDSGCSLDNLAPHQPGNLTGSGDGSVRLQWDFPSDPDFLLFEIYRGTQSNFVPSADKRIGTTRSNNYSDPAAPNGIVYYCVAAMDSAGNRSAYSPKMGLFVTGIDENGKEVPHQFSCTKLP